MRIALAVASLLLATVALAAPPEVSSFLGYEVGARVTPHHRIAGYFEALAAESPNVSVARIGTTYEGRPLLLAIVTSESNQQRLTELEGRYAELRSASTREAAERLSESLPIIVWLAAGVHGNEASSPEAAMLIAERLLEKENASLLERAIVIIDPVQNPDGHERYVASLTQRLGRRPNSDPASVEHREPWPHGRDNHYLIDLNRDWLWATQRETQARIAAYRRWNPQVFVDLHEMSYKSSYFFPPDADPINANIAPETEKWLEVFGRANANVFSQRSWPFFVGETFDLFYPGYGDSWPSLRGAVGMTFEVGGNGGALMVEREDETLLTLHDRVDRHLVASLTTVKTAVANRTALLLHSWEAVRRPGNGTKTSYVVEGTLRELEPLARLLRRQGIEFGALKSSTRLRATSATTGERGPRLLVVASLVVPGGQPNGALVDAMFERTPALSEDFIESQRRRVDAEEDDEFYDITSWSVAFASNVNVYAVDEGLEVVPWPERTQQGSIPPARFGYFLSPVEADFYRVLGRLLGGGVRFSVSTTPLERGADFPRGTILIERHRNDDSLEARLVKALEGTAARLHPVEEVWTEGVALGSNRIVFVREPRIALVQGEGIEPTSLGSIWHSLDVDHEIPHSVIDQSVLTSNHLFRYNVVILPDGGIDLTDALGKEGVAHLKRWVEGGGTIIGIRRSADALRQSGIAPSDKEDEKEKSKEEEEKEQRPHLSIPGAAFRTVMNERTYLTFGVARPPAVLLRGLMPLRRPTKVGEKILTIAEQEPLASGFAWPEAIERIRGAAYLAYERVGAGSVITFADDPNYRLFWSGTLPLLLNAAVYSPSFHESR